MAQAADVAVRVASAGAADLMSSYWFEDLRAAVAHLLAEDFEGLIQLLYRLDVDEHKLRDTLAELPATDADVLITKLLVERRLQALRMRKNMATGMPPSPDDPDAW